VVVIHGGKPKDFSMREKNIFYKLTSENENATTELLCNLCKYDDHKNAIMDVLTLSDMQINFDDISTQQSISENKKIPDIVIENNNIIIYIENKIDRNYKLRSS
jgi:hypothetical protein